MQRFHFNRSSGESIATYIAALCELALHCDYGDKLQEMVRAHLVCGVNHKGIQRKLLSEMNLTYEKALVFAQAIEASERDATVEFHPGAIGALHDVTSVTDNFGYIQYSSREQWSHRLLSLWGTSSVAGIRSPSAAPAERGVEYASRNPPLGMITLFRT